MAKLGISNKENHTMKRTVVLAALGLLLAAGVIIVATSCTQAAAEPVEGALTSTFEDQGMTCGGCEASIRLGVRKLDGVVDVQASYKEGSAEVTYDPDKVTSDQIAAAISKVGYSANLVETNEAAPSQQDRGQ